MIYRTLKDIEKHPAVQSVTRNYDGRGTNLVELKPGFLCWDAGSIIGSVKSIIEDLKFISREE